jgi:hypothetical protein
MAAGESRPCDDTAKPSRQTSQIAPSSPARARRTSYVGTSRTLVTSQKHRSGEQVQCNARHARSSADPANGTPDRWLLDGLFDTGHNRKTDAHDAHAVAAVAVRTKTLRVLQLDGELEALRMLTDRRETTHQTSGPDRRPAV